MPLSNHHTVTRKYLPSPHVLAKEFCHAALPGLLWLCVAAYGTLLMASPVVLLKLKSKPYFRQTS